MPLVATVVVFVTSARSPEALATNRGKVINWRDANPFKARRQESEDSGFKSRCQRNIFPREIYVKVYLYDQFAVEFVH